MLQHALLIAPVEASTFSQINVEKVLVGEKRRAAQVGTDNNNRQVERSESLLVAHELN